MVAFGSERTRFSESNQRRSSGEVKTVVEWEGKRESVILTRRRGDAETSAEKRRSQEKTSAETAEDGGLRCGAGALFGEQLAEKQWGSQDRGGMGGETRECDFDAEARVRGDKRGEAAKSREDERGDSGGSWPSVRSGRAFQIGRAHV